MRPQDAQAVGVDSAVETDQLLQGLTGVGDGRLDVAGCRAVLALHFSPSRLEVARQARPELLVAAQWQLLAPEQPRQTPPGLTWQRQGLGRLGRGWLCVRHVPEYGYRHR